MIAENFEAVVIHDCNLGAHEWDMLESIAQVLERVSKLFP